MSPRTTLCTLALLWGTLTAASPALAQVSNQGRTAVASGQLSVAHGLAYDAKHDVYLMVYESPSGVQGRFVNTSGATVGNAFMIASTAGLSYVNKPMVAYSTNTADDVFFVMFATDRGKQFDGPPSAYIQRVTFTGSGGALQGGPFLASDGVYELPNDIVFNPFTRQFVAVWERIFSQGADVLLRFINVDGTASGGIVNVSAANWSQGAAKAAVDWETNRIMIAYQGVHPNSPANPEVLGLWAKVVDGSNGVLLTGLLTVQNGFTIEPVPVFLPERDGFLVAWTGFTPGRDVQGRFVSSASGSVGTMPASVYTISGTSRSEGAAMGMYDAISRRVLMAVQSSGGCPNDTCPYLDGAVLDALGTPLSVFTGLSTATPSTTGGSFYPDVAAGENGQFGISYTLDYIADYVERVGLPAAATPGPIFGGGGPGGSTNVVATPGSLSFSVTKNGSAISGFSPQSVSVTFAASPVAWTATTSAAWLQVTGGTGNGNGSFSVTVINPSDVIGSQTSLSGSVVLTAPGAPNSPVTLPVSATVVPAGGVITGLGRTAVASGQLSVAHGLAYAARHDVYLMVYESPSGVQGRFVNVSGATVGNAFMIASTAGLSYVNKPMVAYSTNSVDDVFFVMFATDRGKQFDGPPSAYIQRVTFTGSGGALQGGPFLASDGVYELPNDIVFNPVTRQFVAVWERIFSQGADVLLRFFNVSGTAVGSIVNVSAANWSQGAAKAAVDWETNRIMIAYQGVHPNSPPTPEVLGLWAKIVDGSNGAILTGLITVQNGFTIEPVPVFLPERHGFAVAWTGFTPGRDVQARFVSSATGSIGTMPAGVYTISGTSRQEGAAMGMYEAHSRRVLMAVQSSGACPNDTCPYLDGAILDGQGTPLSVFTGLSTATPSSTGGTFYPDVAVGENGQFGISYTLDYIADYVERVSLPTGPPGPEFLPDNSAALSTGNLSFAVTKVGSAISGFAPQTVGVSFTTGAVAWSAASSVPWLQVTNATGFGSGDFTVTVINPGDVIGSQTSLNGSVVLTAAGTVNSPVTLAVSATVSSTLPSAAPFGQVDTPVQNAAGVQGALAVTGWALDDTQVSSLDIYRNCLAFEPQTNCQPVLGTNMVWLGQAVFIAGARSDVEATFPAYPNANRAGWGVQILTNTLPHIPNSQMTGGQGPLTLYAVATDNQGNRVSLGRSYVSGSPTFSTPTSITMANDTIAKPFGMIDTPAQGQIVSGIVPNFGWALTPDNDSTQGNEDIFIPSSGATVGVLIDGVLKGTVTFNQCRGTVGNPVPGGVFCNDDIANMFGNATPQATLTPRSSNPTRFRNLDAARGAIGSFLLDTTQLSNGLHTISWAVMDSAGRSDGIGSRFFTVLNPAPDAPKGAQSLAATSRQSVVGDLDQLPVGDEGVWGRTGFDASNSWQGMPRDARGERHVRLPEMGRLELWLGSPIDQAYLVANGQLRPLPPGSTVDGAMFSWAPGPGLVGEYSLVFVRGEQRIEVKVTIAPRASKERQPAVRLTLDVPSVGGWSGRSVTVTGWALDSDSAIGSGIEAVHVWARRLTGQSSKFLGAAVMEVVRPDVARAVGARFSHSGFTLTASLEPGEYELTAYVWNRRTSRWEDARSVVVTVR